MPDRLQRVEDGTDAVAHDLQFLQRALPVVLPACGTAVIDPPTIGIGASSGCDGQILVTDDMLGMFDWTPKFVRRYADLKGEIDRAVATYARDVRERRFPAEVETYFSKKPVSP